MWPYQFQSSLSVKSKWNRRLVHIEDEVLVLACYNNHWTNCLHETRCHDLQFSWVLLKDYCAHMMNQSEPLDKTTDAGVLSTCQLLSKWPAQWFCLDNHQPWGNNIPLSCNSNICHSSCYSKGFRMEALPRNRLLAFMLRVSCIRMMSLFQVMKCFW